MTFSGGLVPPKAGNRHGWNSLDHYLTIHHAQLKRLGEFFVEDDCLQIQLTDEGTLRIEGLIWCKDDIFLDVNKTLEINERNQVRTVYYKYHAGIQLDGETKSIFRYDNAHVYTKEGHADAHHKHCYNHMSGEEIRPPEWIGHDRWPTLTEVLEELHEWWQEAGQFIRKIDDPTSIRRLPGRHQE